MKRSADVAWFPAGFAMIALILDSSTALTGARDGLKLCLETLIPSLFPFFVISIYMTSRLSAVRMKALDPLCGLVRIPREAGSLLLMGLLGGYPVGAGCVAAASENGSLSPSQARRMLAFSNQPGPAFLFGVTSVLFSKPGIPWMLWLIQLLSCTVTAWAIPPDNSRITRLPAAAPQSLPGAASAGIRVMAGVCGWVVLFRTVIAFWQRWFGWLLPNSVQIVVAGILELANGCCALAGIPCEGGRFILCAGMLAFGGICVWMQTATVAGSVDRILYLPGKLLQGSVSVLLAAVCQNWLFPADRAMIDGRYYLLMAAVCCVLWYILRKISGNPGTDDV